MKTSKFLVAFAVILALSACSKVPVTNRKQLKLLPESLVIGMSLTSYKEFLSANTVVSATDEDAVLVKTVGGRIKDAVIKFMSSKGLSKRIKNYGWAFNLVSNSTVNAWCMPGGKVVVYTGILDYTQDEYGMATVISHEVAHAVARHGNERMSQQLAVLAGGVSLSVALNEKPEQTKNIFLMCYGVGSTLGMLAYSRLHEYEADKLGMIFMALAGYEPSKSIEFWERMAKTSSGVSLPQFLSTHPSDENRIKALKEFLPKAMAYYPSNK